MSEEWQMTPEEMKEKMCGEINKLIDEDVPAFTPVGPFKGIAVMTDKGWRTSSLIGDETLMLKKAKMGKSKKILFEFEMAVNQGAPAPHVELSLEKAEAHLADFREYLMMGLNLDCYLSEALLIRKNAETIEEKKAVNRVEEVERREKTENWGSW